MLLNIKRAKQNYPEGFFRSTTLTLVLPYLIKALFLIHNLKLKFKRFSSKIFYFCLDLRFAQKYNGIDFFINYLIDEL
jgi:hypothetical protein